MAKMLTQTDIANELSWSSVAVGKKLIQLGLRDKESKLLTDKALKANLGKNVEYAKNNEKIKMAVWDRKVINILNNNINVDDRVDILVNVVKNLKEINEKCDDGGLGEKLYICMWDEVFKDMNQKYSDIKKDQKLLVSFLKKLGKNKNINYFNSIIDEKEVEVNNSILLKFKLEKEIKEVNFSKKVNI